MDIVGSVLWVVKMTRIVTAGELLDGHVVLDIECLDRIYLNVYVPILQSSGQVVAFMTQHPLALAAERLENHQGDIA